MRQLALEFHGVLVEKAFLFYGLIDGYIKADGRIWAVFVSEKDGLFSYVQTCQLKLRVEE